MASITIRNLEDTLKAQLRVRAARCGRSMEEEAREILRAALNEQRGDRRDLASAIRARMAPVGGVDLPEIERDSLRNAPELEG